MHIENIPINIKNIKTEGFFLNFGFYREVNKENKNSVRLTVRN